MTSPHASAIRRHHIFLRSQRPGFTLGTLTLVAENISAQKESHIIAASLHGDVARVTERKRDVNSGSAMVQAQSHFSRHAITADHEY